MNRDDPHLAVLLTPEFEVSVLASTPSLLRLRLRKSSQVAMLRERYDQGLLGEGELRFFVGQLLQQYPLPGVFPYQTALAALAVMLENRFTPFADEYLADLSRVRTARLAVASRVARLCLESRRRGTSNNQVVKRLAEIPEQFVALMGINGNPRWGDVYVVANQWQN